MQFLGSILETFETRFILKPQGDFRGRLHFPSQKFEPSVERKQHQKSKHHEHRNDAQEQIIEIRLTISFSVAVSDKWLPVNMLWKS